MKKRIYKNKTEKNNANKTSKIKFVGVTLLAISLSITSLIISVEIASAQLFSSGSLYSSSFSSSYVYTQKYSPSFNNYYDRTQMTQFWPSIFDMDKCYARDDFIIQIPPAGCTPTVVRSDLLEEQPVPVFCQLNAIKVNPIVGVSEIKTINFKNYPSEVSGVGFHPARAALRTLDKKLLGSPIIENIGYVVVLLKPYASEKEMPEFIESNLSALIIYDANKIFGVGNSEFYLPVLTEDEWQNQYKGNSFWKGAAYLRADWVEDDRAAISIYTDATNRVSSITLEKGKTSGDIYLPSYYCRVALNVRLNDISAPEKQVKLLVSSSSGDDEYWLKKGDRFEKCSVDNINIYNFGGSSVDIRCPKEKFTLSLDLTKEVVLDVGGKEAVYETGRAITGNVYPVFVGNLPTEIKKQTSEEGVFLIAIKTSLGEQAVKDKTQKITEALDSVLKEKLAAGKEKNKDWFIEEAKKKIKAISELKIDKEGENVGIIFLKDDKGATIGGTPIKFVGVSTSFEKKYRGDQDKEIENYFSNAKETAFELADTLPDEKQEGNRFYGEMALEEAAGLADSLQKQESKADILSKLIEKYPESSKATYQDELSKIRQYDSEKSQKTTEIDGEFYTIQLIDFKEPKKEDLSVELRVKGEGIDKQETASLDERFFENEKGDEYLKIEDVKEDRVVFNGAYYKATTGVTRELTQIPDKTILLNKEEVVGKWTVHVDKINIKKVASVSLTPKAIATQSESNFTFRIGIEKRAIKLSPEKTQDMLSDLNKTIAKLEKISKTLVDTVKSMKAACFATTAVLTIKNLFQNMGGGALARQEAMRGTGGWYDECALLIKKSPGEYANMNDCLRKNADKVEKTVIQIQDSMNGVENKAKEIYKLKDSALIGEKYREEVLLPNLKGNENRMINIQGEDVKISDVLGDSAKIKKLQDEGYLQEGNMRDISTWLNVLKNSEQDSVAYKRAQSELSKDLVSISEANAEIAARARAETKLPSLYSRTDTLVIAPEGYRTKQVRTTKLTEQDAAKLGSSVHVGDEVIILSIPQFKKKSPLWGLVGDDTILPGEDALVVLDDKGAVKQAYSVGEGGVIGSEIKDKVIKHLDRAKISNFERITPELCNNKWDKDDYKVRFYETSPYKGLPAIVPVDVKTGWYAATKQTLSSFSGTAAYTEAAEVKSFWLVNVGKNGREEFDSLSGDDKPRTMINLETGQPLDQLGCVTPELARKLVNQAIINIESAASQYRAGVREITLPMLDGKPITIKVGTPSGAPSNAQCQDFMSPNDCYLMFNLCDPVLCPSSRCNLGGTYNVDNVVQSGVIGSIALCLPNVKEGIFVPVCLTGIQAGLDSYISILKAKQQCLETSLKTGQMIGICDEIYSIYACEFFWRQLAPIMKYGMPKLLELISGKGTRGGGEYASVSSAWKNMESTVSYFTDVYAVNSMEAFKMRSTDQVGTEVCKVFVSQRYPSGKGFFDSLLEPDSPPQFYAWFDEIPYTGATLPATSHYKVFYHIYAGKDTGSYYSVYLKNPPESSYYASNPIFYVDSGYVANGSFVSQTIDETGPSGYKELCVRIDLKEECGFKKVSTDFAVNYITNEYLKEQVAQNITTQEECISGTVSPLSLLQPNIEEGIQETIQPALYERGIIRVCSTDNPGNSTDYTRWKDVGYCDDKKIKCWLDTSSVENVINQDKGLLNKTLYEVEKMDVQNRFGEVWDTEKAQAEVDKIEKMKTSFEEEWKTKEYSPAYLKDQEGENGKLFNITKSVEQIIAQPGFQDYKAQALFKKFELYREITIQLNDRIKKLKEGEAAGTGAPAGASAPAKTVTEPPTPKETIKYAKDLELEESFMIIDEESETLRVVVTAKNVEGDVITIRVGDKLRYYSFENIDKYIDRYWEKQNPTEETKTGTKETIKYAKDLEEGDTVNIIDAGGKQYTVRVNTINKDKEKIELIDTAEEEMKWVYSFSEMNDSIDRYLKMHTP